MSASVGMMKFPRYGKNVPNRQLRLEPKSRTLYDSLLELQKHLRKQLRVDMESVAPLPPLPCGNFPSPESSLSEWALVIHVLFGCGLPQYCCSNAGNDHHQLRFFFGAPHNGHPSTSSSGCHKTTLVGSVSTHSPPKKVSQCGSSSQIWSRIGKT